jgi:hypothetical protein
MTDWRITLNIRDAWSQAQEGKITHRDLANIVALRLAKLPELPDGNEPLNILRNELVNDFWGISEDYSSDEDDFNYVMDNLYDWADMQLQSHKKCCWVKTF